LPTLGHNIWIGLSDALNKLGNWLAVPRDNDLASFLDLFQEAGEVGLGFENADVFHVSPEEKLV
jgi:hypothetical protein